jgi:hypothetical protein
MVFFRALMVLAGFVLAAPALGQDLSDTAERGQEIRIFSGAFFGDTCGATDCPEILAVRGGPWVSGPQNRGDRCGSDHDGPHAMWRERGPPPDRYDRSVAGLWIRA